MRCIKSAVPPIHSAPCAVHPLIAPRRGAARFALEGRPLTIGFSYDVRAPNENLSSRQFYEGKCQEQYFPAELNPGETALAFSPCWAVCCYVVTERRANVVSP